MEIKTATIKDLNVVTNLFSKYRQFYKQDLNITAERDFMKQRLENKDSIIYIAYVEDEAAGFTQLYPVFSSVAMKRTYILNDLYVNEKHRKLGVAQALINKSYELCEEEDARYLTLQTAPDNEKAQQLYKKMGMVHDVAFLRFTKFW